MTTNEAAEPVALLPCPFCGGEGKVTGNAWIDYAVRCKCGATGQAGNLPETAIENWNCRDTIPEGEPIAWRYEHQFGVNERWHTYFSEKPLPEHTLYRNITPLYTRPSPGEVKVRKLKWRKNHSTGVWTGELIFDAYYAIDQDDTGWRVFFGRLLSAAHIEEIMFHPDLDEAKAAAQAHFDAAILSILSTLEPKDTHHDRS